MSYCQERDLSFSVVRRNRCGRPIVFYMLPKSSAQSHVLVALLTANGPGPSKKARVTSDAKVVTTVQGTHPTAGPV